MLQMKPILVLYLYGGILTSSKADQGQDDVADRRQPRYSSTQEDKYSNSLPGTVTESPLLIGSSIQSSGFGRKTDALNLQSGITQETPTIGHERKDARAGEYPTSESSPIATQKKTIDKKQRTPDVCLDYDNFTIDGNSSVFTSNSVNFTGQTNDTVLLHSSLCPQSCIPCRLIITIEVLFMGYNRKHLNDDLRALPEGGSTVLEFKSIRLSQGSRDNTMRVACKSIDIKVTGIVKVAPVWCPGNKVTIEIHQKSYRNELIAEIRYYSHTTIQKNGQMAIRKPYCHSSRVFADDYFYFGSLYGSKCFIETTIHDIYYLNIPDVFACNSVKEYISFKTIQDDKICPFSENGCGPHGLAFGNECFYIKPYSKVSTDCSDGEVYPAFHLPAVRQFIMQEVSKYRTRYVPVNEGYDNMYIMLAGIQRVNTEREHINYLYRRMPWWKEYKIIVYDNIPFVSNNNTFTDYSDVALVIYPSGNITMSKDQTYWRTSVCQSYNKRRSPTHRNNTIKIRRQTVSKITNFKVKLCPDATHVHPFYYCVTGKHSVLNASQISFSGMQLYRCFNGLSIHYTLLCDGNDDCSDLSDEINCPRLKDLRQSKDILNISFFRCRESKEIIIAQYRCDGKPDCIDGSDERSCNRCKTNNKINLTTKGQYICLQELQICKDKPNANTYSLYEKAILLLDDLKPWAVELDGCGGSYFTPLNDTEDCPETHVRCPDAYCIPTYMLNNGVYDCPHLETDDEYMGADFSCPGYYRCYKSHICVHDKYLCDGIYHCPLKDDERYCDKCPDKCICEGWALKCSVMVNYKKHLYMRYLDVSNVDLSSHNDSGNTFHFPFLHYLNVSNCSLFSINLYYISSLNGLDISKNSLTNLSLLRLSENPTLNYLDISGNPLILSVQSDLNYIFCKYGKELQYLNLERIGLTMFEADVFSCNDSKSKLQKLYISHNNVKLEPYSFRGLDDLLLLSTSDEFICCAFEFANKQSFAECIAPNDAISSCDDLLRSNFFRVFLWMQCLAALSGNGGVLIYRLYYRSKHLISGYHSFVTSLCVSDFAMGVYLLFIGIADIHYKGHYLWQRKEWTQSVSCTVAGILAMMSNEVSSFIICLITLDRLLMVRFPLHRRLHFTQNSAFVASCFAFIIGLFIALIPVLPFKEPWDFYSQNGICLPLPITRRTFPGVRYTFIIFIVVNFIIFLLVGFGQVLIYIYIKVSPKAGRTTNRQQEFALAKRLFLVALSNFCCWFPVGVTGLLASGGTAIPGEVNVWLAVFVLPLNSAINPFLYTFNTLRQNQRRQKDKTRLENLLRKFEVEISTFNKERVDAVSSAVLKAQTRFMSETVSVKYKEIHNKIKLLSEEKLQNMLDYIDRELTYK